MASKKNAGGKSTAKRFAQKRTLNSSDSQTGLKGRSVAGDHNDQDIKRRLGNYAGAGEAHMAKKGARGKTP